MSDYHIVLTFLLSLIVLIFGVGIMMNRQKVILKNPNIQRLVDLVSEGLHVFSKRTTQVIAQVFLLTLILLVGISFLFGSFVPWEQLISFLLGGITMTFMTFLGLYLTPQFIPMIIQQSRGYLKEGVGTLFDVSHGVGFMLIGGLLTMMLLLYYFLGSETIIGYGLGIMVTAFFLRIGGGLYKSAAKISVSILGQKENLPMDQRNPTTILDIVGLYIGEMIGFCSDIFSSFMLAIIASILAAMSFQKTNLIAGGSIDAFTQLPVLIVAVSIVISIFAYLCGKLRQRFSVSNLLLETIYVSVVFNVGLVYFLMKKLGVFHSITGEGPFYAYLLGAIGAVLIALTTDFLTNQHYRPAQALVRQAEHGSVMPMMSSFALGLYGNGLFLFYILLIGLLTYSFSGVYGMAMASLGMLSITISFISSKVFASLSASVEKTCALLSQDDNLLKNTRYSADLGFTTRSLGNSFSAATAVFSTFSLLFAIMILSNINVAQLLYLDAQLMSGLVVGGIVSFFFLGFLLQGLHQCVLKVKKESERQFQDIPYLMEGKSYPDIIKASNEHTIYALKALLIPGSFLFFVPILMAFIFGVKVLLGLVLGIFMVGATQGYTWSNFGGALDNASRYIEKGFFGGPSSLNASQIGQANRYGVVFHEMMGPSLTILIKSISIIAILMILILMV
ncbi:hypothetical protein DID77_01410 [Candidatus Marinamargulisbacteria bacterium SCGC AG-439-L15]|nr:hypothetical protein DID77_01410 [Candidatus Marinamargulisbacteria bacterium SCGC AG-439-L15]